MSVAQSKNGVVRVGVALGGGGDAVAVRVAESLCDADDDADADAEPDDDDVPVCAGVTVAVRDCDGVLIAVCEAVGVCDAVTFRGTYVAFRSKLPRDLRGRAVAGQRVRGAACCCKLRQSQCAPAVK